MQSDIISKLSSGDNIEAELIRKYSEIEVRFDGLESTQKMNHNELEVNQNKIERTLAGT